MDFLLLLLIVGLITWAAGWFLAEWLELSTGKRTSTPGRSSGVDTAIGTEAVVTRDFESAGDGQIRGRVRFEGEDWKALFVGDPSACPSEGEHVTVVDVDASHLEVRVQ